MPRPNPLDDALDMVSDAMLAGAGRIDKMASDTEPFDSVKLSPDEEALVWRNPHVKYIDEKDPVTGLLLSNAQAAARWFKEDPIGYVQFSQEMAKRDQKGVTNG